MDWNTYIAALHDVLDNLSIRDNTGREIDDEQGFSQLYDLSVATRNGHGCIYFVGNGASASMAIHFAADIGKNARIHTNVFSDISLITALANDICYEDVYAEPIKWRMKQGDMLVAISSSGNSPNIVRAVKAAKSCSGTVVTVSAMREDNAIRQAGDLNIYVPAQTYGLAESAHAAILHHWVDMLVSSV